MSKKLVWDRVGEKQYRTGVDQGVLYPFSDGAYGAGVAWNGLSNVSENPSGGEPTAVWADNRKYANMMSAEDFGCTIQAYMSPVEFDACDGSANLAKGVKVTQQKRKTFGFSWRSLLGNDTDGTDFGYEIHLVYGCLAQPSEKEHETVNDSPNAEQLSWTVSTTPVDVPGMKPSAHIIITSTQCTAEELKAFEEILYGSESKDAHLPLPSELVEIFKTSAAG